METYSPRAAIFDLDKTIIATSSALAMQAPLRRAGMLSRSDAVRSVITQIPYLLWGEAEARNDRIRMEMGRISHGWSLKSLNEVVTAAVSTAVKPYCYVDALDAIALHRASGHSIVIASASPQPLVEPLGELLEADFILATQVEVDQGRLTGGIDSFNHGKLKAAAVARLAQSQGWNLEQCWAYSDSISDLPLLELVGHPVTVNPDRSLRTIARERRWPIREFSKTVRLRPSRVAAPVVGVSAAFAAGAIGGWQLRKWLAPGR
ncbi:MAG: HAD-IB family hydrolase [Actinomycetaceae bacterium]|nr:HAD-IB family hydrolase [Actinomycetaceae bacterium]